MALASSFDFYQSLRGLIPNLPGGKDVKSLHIHLIPDDVVVVELELFAEKLYSEATIKQKFNLTPRP